MINVNTVWDTIIPGNSSLVLEYTEYEYGGFISTTTEVIEVTEYGIETHILGVESGDSTYVLDGFSWFDDPSGHWVTDMEVSHV